MSKEGEQLTVVFIPRRSRIRPYKIAKALKYTGQVKLILLCEESFFDKELFEGIFDEVHFFTRKNILFKIPKAEKLYRIINERIGFGFSKMLHLINEIQPDLIHCFAEPYNHIKYVLEHTDIPVVMSDGADFTGISKGIENLDKRTREQEKFCFEHVSGLLYKGPRELGEYYREKGVKFDVPELTWFDHVDEELVESYSKKIKNDEELHFVYTGNISANPEKSYCYYIPLAKLLADQKIHFHIYPNPWQYHKAEEYLKLAETEKYFHFYPSLPMKDLIREISKFDYGLWIHSEEESDRTSLAKMKTGIGNKMFTYIESGLPIIVSNSRIYGSEIIEKNGIGFSVSDSDWPILRSKTEKISLSEIQNNIKRFISKYSLRNNGERVISFYKKIINE